MEKAYDIKALGEYVKAEAEKQGLTLAEEAVEALGLAAWSGVKVWVKESAVMSENKIDDVVAPFIDTVDAAVDALVKKVDLDKDGD